MLHKVKFTLYQSFLAEVNFFFITIHKSTGFGNKRNTGNSGQGNRNHAPLVYCKRCKLHSTTLVAFLSHEQQPCPMKACSMIGTLCSNPGCQESLATVCCKHPVGTVKARLTVHKVLDIMLLATGPELETVRHPLSPCLRMCCCTSGPT